MRILGVMTEDFQFFYKLVRRLKEREESFISLGFNDLVPCNVSVIITSAAEKEKVPFNRVVASDDPEIAINMAKAMKKGRKFHLLTIGIDPGSTTGIAIFGDGKLLLTEEQEWPEETCQRIERLIEGISYEELLVRVGHGDRTIRNRIINSVWPLADRVEIVDETNTTRNTERPDIDAAILISKGMGEELELPPEVAPTEGEVREIQRRSRIETEGRMTISKDLASLVAKGMMTMDEAIKNQQERRSISNLH